MVLRFPLENVNYFIQDREDEKGEGQKVTGRKEPSGWYNTMWLLAPPSPDLQQTH